MMEITGRRVGGESKVEHWQKQKQNTALADCVVTYYPCWLQDLAVRIQLLLGSKQLAFCSKPMLPSQLKMR